MRTGDQSNPKNHERYVQMMKDFPSANQSEKRHVPIKVDCGSVVNKPGLDTHGKKDTLAPMHVSQGLHTHFTCLIRKLIREAEDGNKWMQHVDDVEREAEALIRTLKALNFNADHRAVIALEKKLKEARERLETATEANDENAIGAANAAVDNLMLQLTTYNIGRQYLSRVKKIQGAEELLKEIKAHKKQSSKKPHGPAEYRYNKSFEEEAKVRFRAEHSGFELSNSDGITVLQHWNNICESTTGVHDVDSEDETEANMAKAIKEIMDESKKI